MGELGKASNAYNSGRNNEQNSWYGHVWRMPETQISKQVINWKPPGKRKPGRTRRSWEKDRQNNAGKELGRWYVER